MFLKVMHGPQTADYSLYDDVVSCSFKYYPDADDNPYYNGCFGEAVIWVREPVKTAVVPGFCENKKIIALGGDAFLMNEQGRTISKFQRICTGPLPTG